MKRHILWLTFVCLAAFSQTYVQGPALIESREVTATSAGTKTLTNASQTWQIFTGADVHTLVMADATTLPVGRRITVVNNSSDAVTVEYDDNTTLATIPATSTKAFYLQTNATSNGVWSIVSSTSGGGGGDVIGPGSSTDGGIVLFDGTSGDTVKEATGTGVVHATSGVYSASSVVNADVDAAAAIARSKLASGNNYRIIANSATGVMSENAAITATRAVVSDANGQLAAAATTATEIGYVNGVTSSIQAQLDGKQASGDYITEITGDVAASGPGSAAATIQPGVIDNGMVSNSAAIALSKLEDLASAEIIVGSAGDVPTAVAMSGDVTISNAGVTAIGANKVSNGMLAQVATATFKGRVTGGAGDVETLSATQATSILNNMVGDAGSGGTKGLVPAPASGDALKNLRGDGTFAFDPDQSFEMSNVGIAASVGSNALTIALKQAGGSDCSASSPCYISFRNATLATGQYSRLSVTGALSLVISSGSTLGQISTIAERIYVLAIDSGSGVVLGAVTNLSTALESLISTTAEGGAGAADSRTTAYSTAAQTTKPFRVIGTIVSTQATAGTWASAPSAIRLGLDLTHTVGSLTANRQSAPKFGAAELNCQAASVIVDNPDRMIATIANRGGTAVCAVTFTPGYFTSTPQCTSSTDTASKIVGIRSITTSGFDYLSSDDDAGAGSDTTMHLMCAGD